jgi:DNA replication and repair protein RecF
MRLIVKRQTSMIAWQGGSSNSFMQINHLSLTNFRNYGRLELDLPAGATLLHGANAQGKTNLLEAIYYLATSRSPHADQDQELINWEAGGPDDLVVVGRLTAQVEGQNGRQLIEMRLIREQRGRSVSFRREALVDRRKVRLMDLLGHLRVVLFLPEDVQIITGPPSGRRRYLDVTLCQTDAAYCRALSSYNKLLEQRNALLRRIVEMGQGRDMLSVYDEKMVQLACQIFTRRATFLTELGREAQRLHYERLTNEQETIRLRYLPRWQSSSTNGAEQTAAAQRGAWLYEERGRLKEIMSEFSQSLKGAQEQDLARGASSIGPHRDDWLFEVNGRDLGRYGSRGQQRTAILSLKLAEIEWMTAVTGDVPILLLDEVAAELDENRRALLLNYVQNANQALLTATDLGMFTATFLQEATTMYVTQGQIEMK